MAVIWEKRQSGNHYQVRTAGRSIRLYKNQVFHSQWNESRPLSSGVWDLLFLPALFAPEGSVKRVLVLGVGGGAVIRQYLELLAVSSVVGVELDPIHLQIARDHFGLNCSTVNRSSMNHSTMNQAAVELIQADAIEWLAHYQGPKFDVVIEDLFTEQDGEPVRVVPASNRWFRQLAAVLNPGGTLIVNFEDPAQLRATTLKCGNSIPGRTDSRYAFTLPTYGNCVAAFLSVSASPAELRKKLDALLVRFPASRADAQKFRVRRVLP